ncbi:hypothetical protein KIN20_018833 [Parelaphostrongylus tenuis]|uniref:Uncharacterized protein n=1 Tax=Parelaphostrongylus tenuis TaxID=148309 RepID=A0AAD5MK02_PARTN|nr:hypothetical protein KIN20_018833 [Parelaphostrongylus tenuis]
MATRDCGRVGFGPMWAATIIATTRQRHPAHSNSQLYISSEWLLKLSTFSDPGPVTNYSFFSVPSWSPSASSS